MTILGRSEELVSRCVECDLAEPESLASLGGSALLEGVVATRRTSGQTVGLRVCLYVLVTLEVSLARN